MNFVTSMAQFIEQSKGMELTVKCIDPAANHYSLFIMPVTTQIDNKDEQVEAIANALNSPIRITGTPEEIDEALSNSLPDLTQARITASSNLDEVIKSLATKPAKKTTANKGKGTASAKSNAKQPDPAPMLDTSTASNTDKAATPTKAESAPPKADPASKKETTKHPVAETAPTPEPTKEPVETPDASKEPTEQAEESEKPELSDQVTMF
ncbi:MULTISPECIES: hypothetical protein [Vibrio]|uniref:hypothetical protein n=1 Tax=Vibrio TaxID=662 RepID=UPI00078E1248|nr:MULTISPECIES: hypothetical protein [Vibrio]BAU70948.1 hypothetical protein [Vibrio sp. 04Ya108]BBM67794.1 hypothetical protein VA249_44400 [Vibrio alfacsensis]BCN26965.1 hypothetical protein VYA_41570 [Vibrio alfacsensis]